MFPVKSNAAQQPAGGGLAKLQMRRNDQSIEHRRQRRGMGEKARRTVERKVDAGAGEQLRRTDAGGDDDLVGDDRAVAGVDAAVTRPRSTRRRATRAVRLIDAPRSAAAARRICVASAGSTRPSSSHFAASRGRCLQQRDQLGRSRPPRPVECDSPSRHVARRTRAERLPACHKSANRRTKAAATAVLARACAIRRSRASVAGSRPWDCPSWH